MTRESSFASDGRGVALLQDLLAELRGLRTILESRLDDLAAASNGRNAELEHDAVTAAATETNLLSTRDVATNLGVSARTLRRLRRDGRAPKCVVVGGRPRWRRTDVDAWLAKQRRAE